MWSLNSASNCFWTSIIFIFGILNESLTSWSNITVPEISKPKEIWQDIIPNLKREEILDSNEKYGLIWEVDFKTDTITFQVTVRTLGFVGFGISPNGGMDGSDIVIGGVHANGTAYFSDYFSTGNQQPEVDPKQDWELLEAKENGTHTMLKFKRIFNTCDRNDFKISNDTSNLIWSYGESDQITYHSVNRGSYAVNLLDPPMPSPETLNTSTWQLTSDLGMPDQKTTYWCTIHKGPELPTKHHVIGFEPYLPSPVAKAHTHHFVVHECRGDGTDEFKTLVNPLISSTGDHCYQAGKAVTILSQYCKYLLAWATGGKRVIFPEKVGYPISENNTEVYYILQIHYNNPGKLKGVKFEAGVNLFYTSELREFEAATLSVGHDVIQSQIIPPKLKSFTTVGHCSSDCTSKHIPSSGLNVFNIMLHSHLAGRRFKLRQFRGGKEMAWISNDDNYKYDFQPNRPLREEIKVFPGDHLTLECVYDTTYRDHVTLGGLDTEDEMCLSFMMYYPKSSVSFCGSHYPFNSSMLKLGVEEIEWIQGTSEFRIKAPQKHVGKNYTEFLNEIDWTSGKVKELQMRTRYEEHTGRCRLHNKTMNEDPNTVIKYPNVTEEYTLLDSCAKKLA